MGSRFQGKVVVSVVLGLLDLTSVGWLSGSQGVKKDSCPICIILLWVGYG